MPENPTVVVYNDPSSGVSDADAHAMTSACALQVARDFAPWWHTAATVRFVASSARPPAGAWVIALLDNSDEAGALGYHDLTPDGLPLGKVFAGTDRQYGLSVSVTLSHELLEMLGDPWINLSAQAPDGKFYAWESADAVEDDSLAYEINGIKVSAFVTPAWFGSGAGELTYPAGLASQPLELAAGGYIGVFDPASGQGWTQQTTEMRIARNVAEVLAAEHHTDPVAAAHAVARVGSRRERRARGRGQWVRSTFGQE